MTGVSITIEGLDVAKSKLSSLARLEFHELMDGLARMGQQQTQRRIEEEKTSPEGAAWKPNLAGTPILFKTGALARSVDHAATATQATWGVPAAPVAGRPYARIHQFGGVITPKNGAALKFWWQSGGHVEFAIVKKVTMPARPYLGVSAENAADLEQAAAKFIERYW